MSFLNHKGLPANSVFFAEPTDQYLQSFSWNKVRYRVDRPLSEIIDTLQKVSGFYDIYQRS